MSSNMVWSRFVRIGKCGKVHKLRTQDLPSARTKDAAELFLNIFVSQEPIYKALDIHSNAAAVKRLRDYYNHVFHDSSYHKVITCSDDTDDVKDIMCISIMRLCTETTAMIESEYLKMLNSLDKLELNRIKLIKMIYEIKTSFDPIKEFNLDLFYDDEGIIVVPAYRGMGILLQNGEVKRKICEAHKVPMTGAWVTSAITQRAAAKDGWETVHEITYDYLANKYDVNFANASPTIKYMITRPNLSS